MSTGASAELVIRQFAKTHNVDVRKIQFVNLQAPDQLSAFSNGQVQAIAVWQPWLYRAVNEFGAKMYFTGRQSFIPGAEGQVRWLYLPSGVLVNTKLVKERPHAVKAMLTALLKAQTYIAEQPKRAASIIAADMKVTPEVMEGLFPSNPNHYTAVLDQSVLEGFNTIQDALIAQKILKSKVEMLSLFDLRFLREVAPQLIQLK
jgi:NitT/TauT family transport system substrate-binding protein